MVKTSIILNLCVRINQKYPFIKEEKRFGPSYSDINLLGENRFIRVNSVSLFFNYFYENH